MSMRYLRQLYLYEQQNNRSAWDVMFREGTTVTMDLPTSPGRNKMMKHDVRILRAGGK